MGEWAEDMNIRNLSRFSLYFGHSPDRPAQEEVRAYQVQLARKGALLLRGVARRVGDPRADRLYAHQPRKLPTVLGADEVVRFLEAMSSLTAVRGADDGRLRLSEHVASLCNAYPKAGRTASS